MTENKLIVRIIFFFKPHMINKRDMTQIFAFHFCVQQWYTVTLLVAIVLTFHKGIAQ